MSQGAQLLSSRTRVLKRPRGVLYLWQQQSWSVPGASCSYGTSSNRGTSQERPVALAPAEAGERPNKIQERPRSAPKDGEHQQKQRLETHWGVLCFCQQQEQGAWTTLCEACQNA